MEITEWEKLGLCPKFLWSKDLEKKLKEDQNCGVLVFFKIMAPAMSRKKAVKDSWRKTKYNEEKSSEELFKLKVRNKLVC